MMSGRYSETVKDSRLPKACLVGLQWHWWWFGNALHTMNNSRMRKKSLFWMSTRGANFAQVWIGPLTILWRRPWLRGPAEVHLAGIQSNG